LRYPARSIGRRSALRGGPESWEETSAILRHSCIGPRAKSASYHHRVSCRGFTDLHLGTPQRCAVRDGAALIALAESRRKPAVECQRFSVTGGRSERGCVGLQISHEVTECAHFALQLLRLLADLDKLCAILVDVLLQVCRSTALELSQRVLVFSDLLLCGITKDLGNVCESGKPKTLRSVFAPTYIAQQRASGPVVLSRQPQVPLQHYRPGIARVGDPATRICRGWEATALDLLLGRNSLEHR